MKNKIDASASIMDGVLLGEGITVGKGTLIYPNVTIEDDTHIGPYCIVGEPGIQYYTEGNLDFKPVKIGKGSIIRSHTVIYEDVTIGVSFQTGHHVTIREETTIGDCCSVGTLSDLQGKMKIGNYVRLHSNVNINQLTIIEDYVWIYPRVLTTNDKYPPMGDLIETHICKYAQIGAGSIILPGKTIGENSLVGAGSVVTKDVQPETVVIGNPAKEKCSVRDVRDDEGNLVYPWKEYLTQYRGYPWQK